MEIWALWGLFAGLLLGGYDLATKRAVSHDSVFVVVFWSSVAGAIPFALLLVPTTAPGFLAPWFQAAVLGKSAAMTASWFLAYFSVKSIPLSLAAPVRASGPIWTLALGVAAFGDRLSTIQAAGLVICVAAYWWFGQIGGRSGIDRRTSWIAAAAMLSATWLSAATTVYDKWLVAALGYDLWSIQAASSFQRAALAGAAFALWRARAPAAAAIPSAPWAVAAVGLAWVGAEAAYFVAVADPDSSVTVLAVLRRASLFVAVGAGVLLFRESHLRAKLGASLVLATGLAGMMLG